MKEKKECPSSQWSIRAGTPPSLFFGLLVLSSRVRFLFQATTSFCEVERFSVLSQALSQRNQTIPRLLRALRSQHNLPQSHL